MLGSATLHGWTESAWYIETRNAPEEDVPEDEQPADFDALKPTGKAEVVIEREFRGAGMHPKVDLTIEMGGHGDKTYSINVARHKPIKKEQGTKGGKKKDAAAEAPKYEDVKQQILTTLEMTTKPIPLDIMAKTIGLGVKDIQKFLNQMHDELIITKTPSGWILNED